jgi:RHS repeat-associated protein
MQYKKSKLFKTIEYLHNPNGNMTTDLNKEILNIAYTYHNLPQRIEMNATGNQDLIYYWYDAPGVKLRKQTRIDQAIVATTDYIGSFVYEDNTLLYILTDEGRIVPDGSNFKYQYFLKDHLGNTRILFDENGTVLQDNSYYPFGMAINGLTYSEAFTPDNKNLYNGKELQDDFGLDWYDYGARFYDPQIGRWYVPDPMAEKFGSFSPYSFALNNPIFFIDPDGMNIRVHNSNIDECNEFLIKAEKGPDDPPENKSEKKKVAIDPGHGDKNDKNKQVDPGAVNGEDYEKDIVLNISNATTKKLEDGGYTVTQTRIGDVKDAGTKLQWRIDIVKGTSILVSIHVNASTNNDANGFQVYYKSGDNNSKLLASKINSENALFKDGGVIESDNLYVLNKYDGTAVLVEAGFISNTIDLNILKTKSPEIGNSIATGIINYLIEKK